MELRLEKYESRWAKVCIQLRDQMMLDIVNTERLSSSRDKREMGRVQSPESQYMSGSDEEIRLMFGPSKASVRSVAQWHTSCLL